MILRTLVPAMLAFFALACGEPNVVTVNTAPDGGEFSNGDGQEEPTGSDFAERFAAVYQADTALMLGVFTYTCTCISDQDNEICDDPDEGEQALETRVECLRREFDGVEPPAAMEPYLQCHEELLPQRQQCLEFLNQAMETCSGIPDCIQNFDTNSNACETLFSEELRQWLQTTGVFETCDLI